MAMKKNEYNHLKIEKKWRAEWEKNGVYKTLSAKAAQTKKMKPYYVLDMFPYPSGAGLHVGHPRGYIASDVFARQKRMQGFNVLHPMGFDSFGLPAEQYAIQTGKHPGPFTESLVKRYKEQLSILGFSYDWSRQVATHDPEYYKWTQWIFLQIYNSWYNLTTNKAESIEKLVRLFEKSGNEKVVAFCDADTKFFSAKEWKNFSEIEQQQVLMKYRLAYEGYAEVNWCAELGTVLANDEIIDGPNGPVSERGGHPVEKRKMRQWFMRITAYADRLLAGLETIDWSSSIKEIQKNWIGKSEGSEIDFQIKNQDSKITVFTTRADTLFGVTYVVLAPEHELVQTLKPHIQNWNEIEKYIASVKNTAVEDRTAEGKEKTGVELKGVFATNPANGEQVPVWIADYVLASYGTGAVMAVPAHDERDFEFAKKYDLPIKEVILKKVGGVALEDIQKFLRTGEPQNSVLPMLEYGTLINSGFNFDGHYSQQAKKKITEFVGGKLVTKYKMRDAIFARQRYWGEPIPLVHAKDGTIKSLPEKNLPLKLPNVKSYAPSGTGESPLAGVKAWTSAGYETNTMPGWAGSSWYFLRYIDPKNKKAFADEKELDYWFGKNGGVNMYVGGSEHATGHLLYSRFWHKVLKDLGEVKTEEPFQTLRNQGMILAEDGRKMSKRWGNVINPDDVVKTYGADTMRLYEMFMGPFAASQPWNTESIIGSRRFIERVWRLADKLQNESHKVSKSDANAEKILHKTIKKVSDDIAGFSFNTAVSAMMICLNEFEKSEKISVADFKLFLQILAPFAPHMTDELWANFGEKKSVHISGWPKYDPKKVIDEEITIAIQVNGKVRAELTIPADATDEHVKAEALRHEKILPWLDSKEIKKVIYIRGRLVSIVV